MTNETPQSGPQLTDEQVLNFGQMAGEAFQNPIFIIWHNLMLQKTINAIDSAKPEHTKEVMWQKAKRDVLAEMAKDMKGMVEHAERVYARMQQQNDPKVQEQRELDTQGYGLNFGQGGAS